MQSSDALDQLARGRAGSAARRSGRSAAPAVRSMLEVDRQVRVVAHVQVAGHLRVAADDLVDERVGQEDVEGVDEVVAGGGQLVEHRLELAQRVDGGDLGRLDHPDADVRRAGRGPGASGPGPGAGRRCWSARSGSSSSAASMLPSCWWAESASRLSASIASTICALLVSRLPVKVSIWAEHRADVVLASGDRLVELLGDGLELGHAAAVEDQAQRAEHLLDLGVAAGALERDDVSVAERLVAGAGLGRRQGDELLAEQAGLADLGDRCCRAAWCRCAARG